MLRFVRCLKIDTVFLNGLACSRDSKSGGILEDLNFLQHTFNSENIGQTNHIVLVEDDQALGKVIKKSLEKTYDVKVYYYTCSQQALEQAPIEIAGNSFALITDISFETGPDGLMLIDALKDRGLNFFSIAITGFGSIQNAISATKKGVFHYLTKPFELEDLLTLVEEGFKSKLGIQLAKKETELKPQTASRFLRQRFKLEEPKEEDIFMGMIGRSAAMKKVFETVQKVARTDSTVLINGPSGTGKELIANAIHAISNRADEKKVNVNCGAIPSELLESELFGHTKGAFTGAISSRKGRFEQAHRGSIFLDEIGDMPLLLQVKLLRVLQTKSVEPVGGNDTVDIDVRVITATHRNLEQLVKEGKFREDLYYRFNVIPVRVPALKDRREDLPLLISFFLKKFASADGSNMIDFSDESLELLLSYDWPGNVRELENLIERLVILKGGNVVTPQDLPAKIYRHNPFATSLFQNIFELPDEGVDLKDVLSKIEDSLIVQALSRTKGNKNQASKLLSLNRTTLIEKMKKKKLEISL